MLDIQSKLNCKVNTDWANAGYAWRDAIVVEAVELFDNLPWKWWKKTKADLEQANMEAVDIWHFLLSEILVDKENQHLDKYVCKLVHTYGSKTNTSPHSTANIIDCSRDFIEVSSGEYSTEVLISTFFILLDSLGLNFDNLYKLYIGKAKLNELRWKNDYGVSYSKMWGDIEDNQYLTKLVDSLDVNDANFAELVENGLAYEYGKVKRGVYK